MSYIAFYWHSDLSFITGYKNNEEMSEQDLFKVIKEKKVNIMLLHRQDYPTVVYMDNGNFKVR